MLSFSYIDRRPNLGEVFETAIVACWPAATTEAAVAAFGAALGDEEIAAAWDRAVDAHDRRNSVRRQLAAWLCGGEPPR